MIAEIYVYIYGCSIRRINQMNYQDKLKLLEQSLQTDLELVESFFWSSYKWESIAIDIRNKLI